MSSTFFGSAPGVSSPEVSASDFKFGHFQHRSRAASKKSTASTKNDAESLSRSRLAFVSARPTEAEVMRRGSQPKLIKLAGYAWLKFSNRTSFRSRVKVGASKRY